MWGFLDRSTARRSPAAALLRRKLEFWGSYADFYHFPHVMIFDAWRWWSLGLLGLLGEGFCGINRCLTGTGPAGSEVVFACFASGGTG